MSFTYLFYQHIMFRHSCGKCHYTNTRRPSDITIADFWGWEKIDPNINKDDKGVSLILVNTEKGREIFEAVKDRMIIIPAKLSDCLHQPNLWHPSVIHPQRKKFEKDYSQKGFNYIISKNYNRGLKYIIVENYRTSVKFAKNLVRNAIRKFK
ncbi:f420H2:quinone oxidoreductase [Bacteroides sp. CAG:702]|nr:f420H2:quinone oxidoreductase [Bacteroides sp. CAG:702]